MSTRALRKLHGNTASDLLGTQTDALADDTGVVSGEDSESDSPREVPGPSASRGKKGKHKIDDTVNPFDLVCLCLLHTSC